MKKYKYSFKNVNGLCPYFDIEDTRYYIQDIASSTGYKYELMRISLAPTPKYSFKKLEDLFKWAKEAKLTKIDTLGFNGLTFQDAYHNTYAEILRNNRRSNNITLQKLHKHYSCSCEFDTYNECLEFAQEYIKKHHEISLF